MYFISFFYAASLDGLRPVLVVCQFLNSTLTKKVGLVRSVLYKLPQISIIIPSMRLCACLCLFVCLDHS